MNIGIRHKLFLVLLVVALGVAAGMFFFMQWSFHRGFLHYVNRVDQQRLELLAESLEERYAAAGSWDFLRERPQLWHRLMREALLGDERNPRLGDGPGPEFPPAPPEGGPHRPPPPRSRFEERLQLVDAARRPVVAPPGVGPPPEWRPLSSAGEVVGYLGLAPRKILSDLHQLRFVREQRQAFLWIALAMVAGVALLSFPLARHMVRRVKILATGTHRLASGDYGTRIAVTSRDELGQLSRDFNALALALEEAEAARRRWVADISHELRTPLAVLRGEIEALQDGVRQTTPEALKALHGEVLHLARLVDDLHQLSLSDLGALTYRKEEVDLTALLREAVAAIRGDFVAARLELNLDLPEKAVMVFADADRLQQLLANLFDNTLKYTAAGGRFDIRLQRQGGNVTLDLHDSAPGVPQTELPRLFERLYRVESSRNRAAGGSGLGLAICQNIVEAHGGTILAHASPLGGLWIRIELPAGGTRCSTLP